MCSDFVCTTEGIEEVSRRLKKSITSTGKHRIVIVGGSHSAFSAAWMCLNKLKSSPHYDDINKENEKGKTIGTESNKEIEIDREIKNEINNDASTGSDVVGETDNLLTDQLVCDSSPTSSTKVNCFKEKEKEKKMIASNTSSGKSESTGSSICISNSIVILHRSAIKVFYSMKKEADADNYYDIGVVNKTTGQIHPFGGLRGDSKALWRLPIFFFVCLSSMCNQFFYVDFLFFFVYTIHHFFLLFL